MLNAADLYRIWKGEDLGNGVRYLTDEELDFLICEFQSMENFFNAIGEKIVTSWVRCELGSLQNVQFNRKERRNDRD